MAKSYTPVILADDEYAKQSANVQATNAAKAEAERIAKETFFEPLKTALESDCSRSFYESMNALRGSFDGDEYPENVNFRAHLDAVLSGLPNLYGAAGVSITVPVEIAPETTPEA